MESCTVCDCRPDFLEPCPSCGTPGAYKTHSDTGFPQCHGCDPKICVECAYGARYTCDYFRMRNTLPTGPPKLERQINEAYWEMAEETIQRDPTLLEVKVEHYPGRYVYVVVREPDGRIRRMSSTEQCKICDDVDIRRDVYAGLYARLGQFVCEKCLHKIQCSCGSSSSHLSCSSCMCGPDASPLPLAAVEDATPVAADGPMWISSEKK